MVQDGKLVTFERKTLSETKRKQPIHEKEMWVMIHCFKTWAIT
jgi:hypothetical protein